jgi:hypothetical protein
MLRLVFHAFLKCRAAFWDCFSTSSDHSRYSRHHASSKFKIEEVCSSTPPKLRVLTWQLEHLFLQKFFLAQPVEVANRQCFQQQQSIAPELSLLTLLHKYHIWHQSSDDEHHPA